MTNPHTKELRRRMGAMTPGPWLYRPDEFDDWGDIRRAESPRYRVARAYDIPTPGESRDDRDAQHRRAGTDPCEDNGRAIVTALNITAFLASDGAEEALARRLAYDEWPLASDQERASRANNYWRNWLPQARALIELLAEKGCG